MSKTGALRAAVVEIIGRHAPYVYYGQADPGHPKQYVVYDLEEIARIDNQTTVQMEVNCMDYGTDTLACETMADNIQTAFDHNMTMTDSIMFHGYIDRRQPVYEEDRKIIRRRLLFTLYLYERSNTK